MVLQRTVSCRIISRPSLTSPSFGTFLSRLEL